MAYQSIESRVVEQAIADTSATAKHPLGTRIRAHDTTYGEGEFIYLEGVASTVVGSLVTYDQVTSSTTLATATANAGLPLAVAMSACTADLYGWYQVKGAAVIKKTATKVSPLAKVYLSGTAGRVMGTLDTGMAVWGGVCIDDATVASATSTVTVQLDACHQEGSAAQA